MLCLEIRCTELLKLIIVWQAISLAGAQYHGKLIGSFPSNSAHSVAGTVYAVDEDTIRIIGFNYDGAAPDAFLWGGESGSPSDSGFIIPDQTGSTQKLDAYSSADIEVDLPPGRTVSSLAWISVWCRQNAVDFGHVTIPSDFVPPSQHNLGTLGFSPRVHNVYASAVIILDEKRIKIENLDYDGQGPDAYFWVGLGGTPNNNNDYAIPNETGSLDVIRSYSDETITLTMPDDKTVFDIGHIGLWCVLFTQDFGHVDIPSEDQLNIPPSPLPQTTAIPTTVSATTVATTAPTTAPTTPAPTTPAGVEYHGKLIDSFPANSQHSVAGTVYAVDDDTIRIIGFNYDGTAPDAFLWGGESGSPSDSGFIIPDQTGSTEKLGQYQNVDIEVDLPPGRTVSSLAWISVWCRQNAVNFGHVSLPSNFVPPAPHDLGILGFIPRVHNVYASAVIILNDKQFEIRDLDYDGYGPRAYFWVGPGGNPSNNADNYAIPDENGGTGVLNGYNDVTFTLTMPDDKTVFEIGHIGLWCVAANQDFGHVDIPSQDQLNIPPSPLPQPPAIPTTMSATTVATTPATTPATMPAPTTPAGMEYHGKLIDSFPSDSVHSVSGTVYAVDDDTIRIIGFNYDGLAPDAFLWGGESGSPSDSGFIIPDQTGSTDKLEKYENVDIEVDLPSGKTVSSLAWISVWCRQYAVNFGHVSLPADFVPPAPHDLGTLGFSPRVHDVYASAVIILNDKQFEFRDLDYDGYGPRAYFWVGPGGTPNNNNDYAIPDENGGTGVVNRYSGATITLTMPDDKTVYDIGHIGLWCITFTQDFGHVDIPSQDQLNIPPSPLPQTTAIPTTEPPVIAASQNAGTASTAAPTPTDASGELVFTNCETLVVDEFQVSWLIDGPDIVIRLSSTNAAGEYASFGISGSTTGTQMIGGDVVVAFIDDAGDAQVVDYYLQGRAQCTPQSGAGACPDTIASASAVDDVELVSSSVENGVTQIVYRRPLTATDSTEDKTITTAAPMYVIWARGDINDDGRVAYHNLLRSPANSDLQIDFGRASSSACSALGESGVETDAPDSGAWVIPGITELEDANFTAEMGLSGGSKGFDAITGRVGWGIAWFINGQLIPEITVARNRTYTFFVRGGNDSSVNANYHPFYITDSADGGYAQLSAQDQSTVTIYAGPEEGPLCQYEHTGATGNPTSYDTFEEYAATLRVACQPGEPAQLVWTVEEDTPDLVYYQCYTHRFLGWKIHVTDGQTDDAIHTTEPPVTAASQTAGTASTAAPTPTGAGGELVFTNCETLVVDEFQVSWLIDGPDIVIRLSSKIEVGEYASFGISGSTTGTQMIGGDVVVAFIDDAGEAQVVDYYLQGRAQCTPQSRAGACPDTIASASAADDVELVSSSVENGVTHIIYRRPLAATDSTEDKTITTAAPMYIVWARGDINEDGRVAYHNLLRSPANSDLQIDFGRASSSACSALGGSDVETDAPGSGGWVIPGITELEDANFTAEMGLSGGSKGFDAITGRVGWGIAWFINGQLIPEITVVRNRTYTFFVRGGNDSSVNANYHPFYITDSADGGYAQLSAQDQSNVTIYAGPEEGPLCQYEITYATGEPASYETFEEFAATLRVACQPGEPAQLVWTVAEDTPDLVYYQCYTHRFLGWKIHVTDGQTDDLTTDTPGIGEEESSQTDPTTGGATRFSSFFSFFNFILCVLLASLLCDS